MNCLIITNHFFPETFRVNDIAFELAKAGHQVTVLTAIPDYPQGHFFKGYGFFKKRKETVRQVQVIRAAVLPRGKGGTLRLILNYISVFISFIINGWILAHKQKFDYIFIHDTSPAFIIFAGTIVKHIQKCPLDIWILDMWPESLSAGNINNHYIYSMIHRMMDYFYRRADILHISSLGFAKMLKRRNIDERKIRYLPNWADISMKVDNVAAIPSMPKGFIVMFAGNLGGAQNLSNVMQAAKITAGDKDLHWVFVGDGRKRPTVEQYIKNNRLEGTVHLLGRYPIETMPQFFARADVMLVSLADKPNLNMTLPAKVQAYMSNSKPIIAMMNGEGQHIITEAQCGRCVDANDVRGLAETARQMKATDKEELLQMGRNGKKYYDNHFTQSICMEEIRQCMQNAVKK